MSKITVEVVKRRHDSTRLRVSDDEEERVSQIARRAFRLLEEVQWDEGVEVIKVTVEKRDQFSMQVGQSLPFLMTEFQIPFVLPHGGYGLEEEFSKENRLVAKVRWQGHHAETLQVYLGEMYLSRRDIELKNTEIETVARGIIQAMQHVVFHRQSRFQRMADWLNRGAQRLEPLLEAQAAA